MAEHLELETRPSGFNGPACSNERRILNEIGFKLDAHRKVGTLDWFAAVSGNCTGDPAGSGGDF